MMRWLARKADQGVGVMVLAGFVALACLFCSAAQHFWDLVTR